MTRVRFITTEEGEEFALLPRADYERIAAAAGEDTIEDLAVERIVDRALAAIARGEELVLPAEVSDRISAGENPIRVLREWREVGQAELAVAAGTTQRCISDLETGRTQGHPQLHRKIADYLKVPLDLLVP